jgi:prefoldin beta subunit
MAKIDSDLEKDLIEYETLEKQLQMIVLQKHQLQLQLNEINLADEELKKAKSDVYRSIGAVMIKSSVEEAQKELKERKELIEIRLNAASKQEEKLRATLLEFQKKIQQKMKEYEKPAG